ncbi:MAG: hypothetical protein HYX48_01720 [Chlamydiales bacterium]|nr:hypothetical protein [Chlamydiales bacterium]
MFTPKYRVLLTSKCFLGDKVVCLGTQLVLIINSLKGFLPQHTWYGADVDAVGKGAKKYNLNDSQLNPIGADSQFVEYCAEIQQFMWGVFLCVDSSFSSRNIQGVELETEDASFRPIDCDGVLLEIRAFDTSYFAIYAEDLVLIERIANTYDVAIENCKS